MIVNSETQAGIHELVELADKECQEVGFRNQGHDILRCSTTIFVRDVMSQTLTRIGQQEKKKTKGSRVLVIECDVATELPHLMRAISIAKLKAGERRDTGMPPPPL